MDITLEIISINGDGKMNKTTCNSEFVIQSNYFKPEKITEILKITPHKATMMNEAKPNSRGTYSFSTLWL